MKRDVVNERTAAEVKSLTVKLQRARERSRRNARLAEERRVVIVATMERLEEIGQTLRNTATGVRLWWVNRDGAGAGRAGVHPLHAANRLERLADEINATGKGEQGSEQEQKGKG